MSVLTFCFTLYRANPAVSRTIEFSDTFTVNDLTDLLEISVGLQGKKAEFFDSSGKLCRNDEKIKDIMAPGDSGKIIFGDTNDKSNSLCFFADFVSEEKRECKVPKLTEAWGNQLPKDVLDVSMVNQIHQEFTEGTTAAGERWAYDNSMLNFNFRLVDNEIKKRFDPENAIKMVNMDLSIPSKILYGEVTKNKMEDFMHNLGYEMGSSARKEDYVEFMAKYFGRHDKLDTVFENICYGEFKSLTEAITERTLPENIMEKLPTFAGIGAVCKTKKGIYFSKDFLEYCEEMGEENERPSFQQRYYLLRALKAAFDLYGVIDFDRFYELAFIASEGMVSEKMADNFFYDYCKVISRIRSQGECYSRLDEFNSHIVKVLWEAVPHDIDLCYVPKREEILNVDFRSEYKISDKNRAELDRLTPIVFKDSYRGGFMREEKIINYFKIGGREENFVDSLNEHFFPYWARWIEPFSEDQKNFIRLWFEEAGNIPQYLLGGYTKNNCPPKTMERLKKIKPVKIY